MTTVAPKKCNTMSGNNGRPVKAAKEEHDILPNKSVILEVRRKILEIVESMLEAKISANRLIENCRMLSQSDYDGVVEERNIINLCGYPICSNHIQKSRQLYRIVVKVNRVYSIKERKCFCSDKCYKASNFLKQQLLETPVWLQEEPVVVKLLPDNENRGSIGEVVTMVPENVPETAADVDDTKSNWYTKEDEKLLHDEMKKCAKEIDQLEIKENSESGEIAKIMEETLSRCAVNVGNETSSMSTKDHEKLDETSKLKNDCEQNDVQKTSALPEDPAANIQSPALIEMHVSSVSDLHIPSESAETASCELDVEGSDLDRDRYFLPKESKNISEKLMPVFSKSVQRSILIEPISSPNPTVNSFLLASNPVSLSRIEAVLLDWITDATLKYVYGDAPRHSVQSEERTRSFCIIDEESVAKLDKWDPRPKQCVITMENDPTNAQEFLAKQNNEQNAHEFSTKKSDEQVMSDLYLEKVKRFFPSEDKARKSQNTVKFKTGGKGNIKVLRSDSLEKEGTSNSSSAKEKDNPVTVSSATNNGNSPVSDSGSESPFRLPMVDSLSQSHLRQQIVRNKLKIAFTDFLPLVGLNYRILGEIIIQLVSTFRLTAVNVILKPNEWKLVAVVLFRMLLKGHLLKDEISDHLINDTKFAAFLEKIPAVKHCSVSDIDGMINKLFHRKMST